MADGTGAGTTGEMAGVRLDHSVGKGDGTFLIEVTAMHETATVGDNRLWFALGDALGDATAKGTYPEFTRLATDDGNDE